MKAVVGGQASDKTILPPVCKAVRLCAEGCVVIWAWPEFLEFVFGHLRVREGVEIVEILEIWGLERVWKVEILESWPSKCLISSRVEI